jgi:glycosyltransferase involved in cell wall biosynthesis
MWIVTTRRSILVLSPRRGRRDHILALSFIVSAGVPGKMHILKVVQFYFPFQDRGGPVFKVRALARKLVQRGHEVTILTADLGLEKHEGLNSSYEQCQWGWRATNEGIETIYLSTLARYHALTVNPHVNRYAHQSLNQFDLVHFYGLYDFLGPVVSYYCRRQGIPYFVEPMGMYRPIDRSLRIKRLWHRSLGRSFLRRATALVATSQLERQELLKEGISAEKLIVRYNGIDSDAFASKPARGTFRAAWRVPADEPLVLFLSRLIPRKNSDMLIEAFAEACPKHGRLVIAGPEGVPGYLANLKRVASKCGIESHVIFTGPLYDDAKVAAMTDADVFVLPSRYENFANAPGEAVACGVPVIVTDTCGISTLIEGRAGLVIKPELNPLINALRTILTDRDLYDRFKRGCRVVADELSWDKLARQMETCYAQATSQKEVIGPVVPGSEQTSAEDGFVESRK